MTGPLRDVDIDRLRVRLEPFVPYGLAIVVGLAAGASAIVFRELISAFDTVFFDWLGEQLGGVGSWPAILVPAVGGLLVGPIIYFLAREAKGHGVPEVMLAVETAGGRIRPRVAAVKAVASAITIGSGGSVGREGPIVQIASAVASTIGQIARLSDDNIRLLVAAGAAGGISATFNAPIAGVFFALEVILRHFNVRNFSVVVLSSVVADAIGHARFGDQPAFAIPAYRLESPFEFPLYAALGILAALAAILFVRLLYRSEDAFDKVPLPEWSKAAVGGLGIGLLGFWYIELLGVGYGGGPSEFAIPSSLAGERAFHTLIALAGLKILATSVTIGSGGSGGVFAPSLFIGAMVGGAFGELAGGAWPGVTAPSGAYAMVGMAAVFAAAARAPITSILILFEMTRDYSIILPLMTAVVVSVVVSQVLMRDTIYTLKLRRRGVDLGEGPEVPVLARIPVGTAMSRDFAAIRADAPAEELLQIFSGRIAKDGAVPVLDDDDRLVGIVTTTDVERIIASERDMADLKVKDCATAEPVTIPPDQTLDEAVRRMSIQSLRQLPVVSRGEPVRLLGMLRRSDIFRAYSQEGGARRTQDGSLSRLAGLEAYGTELVELSISSDSPLAGKRLADIELPRQSVVVSIIRNGVVVIPKGDTVLAKGDWLLVVTTPDAKDAVLNVVARPRPGEEGWGSSSGS